MNNTKKPTPPKGKQAKNLDKHQIEQKLEVALSDMRTILGEKKFKSRIRKARKIIGKGLPKAEVVKEPAKKAKKEAGDAVAQ